MNCNSSAFQRVLLPAFAFQAVVIGGGYATGRELVEFFLGSGPWGGILGLAAAMVLFSAVCMVTFRFAQLTRSFDGRRIEQPGRKSSALIHLDDRRSDSPLAAER